MRQIGTTGAMEEVRWARQRLNGGWAGFWRSRVGSLCTVPVVGVVVWRRLSRSAGGEGSRHTVAIAPRRLSTRMAPHSDMIDLPPDAGVRVSMVRSG